jgi:Protein of unknown function (DUF3987)
MNLLTPEHMNQMEDPAYIAQMRRQLQTPTAQATEASEPDPFTFSEEERKEFAASSVESSEPDPDGPIQHEIQQLESVNAELEDAIDADIPLPLVPDGPAEDKLAALYKRNLVLVEQVNKEQSEDEQGQAVDQPQFGHGLTVPLRMLLKGEETLRLVDESGTDVDSGEIYNLSPELRKQLDQALEKRRAQIANEAIDQEKEPHSYYAMTMEDYELESEKEFPVYILPKQPGPSWDDSILYGAAGDVIRKASKFNESHPAGMLVDLLVSLGSIIGRGPYFSISSTKHYTNEFMARVGDSSTSRKGTGRDVIDEILKLVDAGWYSDRIQSGFGSGEAIISHIRDARVEMRMGKDAWQQINVPGVSDKRLCIREGELASVFVLAGKPESRADIVLRDGWDGKPLRNMVKGKNRDGFSNSTKCEEPHISISGDTTISELRKKMPPGADENGFGNRFLYVYVYRVKDCPQGSPALNWDTEIVYFQKAVQFAKAVRHVSMTDSARKWWNNNYFKFEHDGPSGLAGKFTSRGSAHLRRIAMLYALLDMKDQIGLEHFHAAQKLWDYCSDSAMYIFGGATREQLRMVQWIGMRGPVTFKQIREELYQRNKSAGAIRADVNGLVKSGHLFERGGKYATLEFARKLIA